MNDNKKIGALFVVSMLCLGGCIFILLHSSTQNRNDDLNSYFPGPEDMHYSSLSRDYQQKCIDDIARIKELLFSFDCYLISNSYSCIPSIIDSTSENLSILYDDAALFSCNFVEENIPYVIPQIANQYCDEYNRLRDKFNTYLDKYNFITSSDIHE